VLDYQEHQYSYNEVEDILVVFLQSTIGSLVDRLGDHSPEQIESSLRKILTDYVQMGMFSAIGFDYEGLYRKLKHNPFVDIVVLFPSQRRHQFIVIKGA
jgi:hypothetical protein